MAEEPCPVRCPPSPLTLNHPPIPHIYFTAIFNRLHIIHKKRVRRFEAEGEVELPKHPEGSSAIVLNPLEVEPRPPEPKPKPKTKHVETHAFSKMSSEEWAHIRGLKSFAKDRRARDEKWWDSRKNEPGITFDEKTGLPEFPSLKTSSPVEYSSGIKKQAAILRELLMDSDREWAKQIRVWKLAKVNNPPPPPLF